MSKFASRPRILHSAPENPRDSWPSWTDIPVELGPIVPELADDTPRWRSLSLTSHTDELDSLDGSGPRVLEDLVRLAHDKHRADLAEALAAGDSLAAFVASSGDLVIWDDGRVVAVLRVLADGSLEDSRFSRTGFLVDPCDCPQGGGR